MKPSYQYLEHTADVLFVAKAESLNQLFEQSALAVEETMVEIKKVEKKKKKLIREKHKNIEGLLFAFLSDLIYYKDAEQLIFSKFDVRIKEEKSGGYTLICQAFGEKINPEKHLPKVDIKAITLHMFEVKKTAYGWWAKVLVDI